MWVPPDTQRHRIRATSNATSAARSKSTQLFPLASGREPDAAITIHQHDATLWITRLNASARTTIPDAPFVHVFVARGAIELEGAGELAEGDAARLTEAGALTATATEEPTELVVWET